MADRRKTIFHAYAIVPLLAICLAHALVWLSTKSLADFSRAFDVTLGFSDSVTPDDVIADNGIVQIIEIPSLLTD